MAYHTYHTNKDWRRLLEILATVPHGASGRWIANKIGYSLQKTDGLLRRMREKSLCKRTGTVWLPYPI